MTFSKKSVMVVDDDIDLRDALADVLVDEGYSVQTAGDGLEALEILRQSERPGVILLDWMMPRCGGAQFRKRQLADANLSAIPVVLLTADTRLDEKKRGIEAAKYLKKPVALDRLLEIVEQYCR